MKPSNIGGQAVMEGIMMRHKDKYSIAVRRPDKEIEVKVEDYKCIFGKARIWRKPIIRGMVSFIDSLVTGTKCLMYSAEIAGDEEDEEETRKKQIVKSALSTLSYSELDAIEHIFDELEGREGILVASKIAPALSNINVPKKIRLTSCIIPLSLVFPADCINNFLS